MGFSLIEVLVSFALVFLLLTGASGLLVHSLQAKKRAEFHLAVASLASSKLEHLKSFPFDSLELEAGGHKEMLPDAASHQVFWREWRIEDRNENMKEVKMEVFSGENLEKKFGCVLLIYRGLGF